MSVMGASSKHCVTLIHARRVNHITKLFYLVVLYKINLFLFVVVWLIRELVCLTSSLLLSLNQDNKGYNTPNERFIIWILCANSLVLTLLRMSLAVVFVYLVDLKMENKLPEFHRSTDNL